MPDILSDDDLSPLAAEYVLGTLDSDERTRANVLLDVDHQFRGIVRVWERRLGELHLMVEPVEPDPKIWERIKGKLKDVAPPSLVATPAQPPAPGEVKSEPKSEPKFETRPTISAETGLKLAGLIEEVEKITESAKASTDPKPEALAEPGKAADMPAVEVTTDAKAKGESELAAKSDEAALSADPIETKLAETKPDGTKLPPVKNFDLDLGIPDDLKIGAPKPAEPKPVEVKQDELAELRLPERVSRETPPPLIPELTLDHLREQPGKAKAKRPPRVAGWRAYGALMTLVAIALGGLIAAWRYVPDRLPPQLRPSAVLLISEAPAGPVRKPAPPESQFDE